MKNDFSIKVEGFFIHIFGEKVTCTEYILRRGSSSLTSVGVSHEGLPGEEIMIHWDGEDGYDWSWGNPGKLNRKHGKDMLSWMLVNAAERLTVAVAKNKTGVGD